MKRAARTRIQNFFQPIMYDSTQSPAIQSGHSTSTVGAIAVGVSANSKVPVRSSICAVLRVSHKTWLPPNCIEKIELQWKTRARRATAVYFSIIFIYLWKREESKEQWHTPFWRENLPPIPPSSAAAPESKASRLCGAARDGVTTYAPRATPQ